MRINKEMLREVTKEIGGMDTQHGERTVPRSRTDSGFTPFERKHMAYATHRFAHNEKNTSRGRRHSSIKSRKTTTHSHIREADRKPLSAAHTYNRARQGAHPRCVWVKVGVFGCEQVYLHRQMVIRQLSRRQHAH